jgi:hypothetical protein
MYKNSGSDGGTGLKMQTGLAFTVEMIPGNDGV